jgi:hypothetical protein
MKDRKLNRATVVAVLLSVVFKDRREGWCSRKFVLGTTQVDAFVDSHDLAFLKEAAKEGADQRLVSKEASPVIKAKVGGEEGAFSVASNVQEAEEVIDLGRIGRRHVAKFINEQKVNVGETFGDGACGFIGEAGGKLIEEVMGLDGADPFASVESFQDQGGGESCFADARRTDEDEGFTAVNEVQFRPLIEQLFVDFFLDMKGKGVECPEFGQAAAPKAAGKGSLAFVVKLVTQEL